MYAGVYPCDDLTGIPFFEKVGRGNQDGPFAVAGNDCPFTIGGIEQFRYVCWKGSRAARCRGADKDLAFIIDQHDLQVGHLGAEAVVVDERKKLFSDGGQALFQAILHAHTEGAVFEEDIDLAGRREPHHIVTTFVEKNGERCRPPAVLEAKLFQKRLLQIRLGGVIRGQEKGHVEEKHGGDDHNACNEGFCDFHEESRSCCLFTTSCTPAAGTALFDRAAFRPGHRFLKKSV